MNKETSLKRPGDHWGLQYDTLINLIIIFSFVVDVLGSIADDNTSELKGSVTNLLHVLEEFDFVFEMDLMRDVLGTTN